ncbi:hypothetical protein NSQ26_05880 [Bacillus sp. FSL W7-1360]
MTAKEKMNWGYAIDVLQKEHGAMVDLGKEEYHVYFSNCCLSIWNEDGETKVHFEPIAKKACVYVRQDIEVTGLFDDKE